MSNTKKGDKVVVNQKKTKVDNLEYKQRVTTDCLTCCVAFYFKISYEKVPHFVKFKDWDDRLRRFFGRRGLKIEFIHYHSAVLKKNKFYFVQGQSWRDKKWHHVTIYKGNKPYFDPSHSNKFLKGEPKFIIKPTKRVK